MTVHIIRVPAILSYMQRSYGILPIVLHSYTTTGLHYYYITHYVRVPILYTIHDIGGTAQLGNI